MHISKKITALILAFLVFNSYFYSQQESGGLSSESVRTVSVAAESDVPFSVSADPEPRRPSTFWMFFRMILVLAFVIACIYGVMWLMKRSMKTNPKTSDPFLRNVSSIDLAVGRSVHVVTLLDRAYVIGVSENSVNLIGEVDGSLDKDRELINAMNLYADEHQNVKKPRSFADVLEIFMPNGPKDFGGFFGDSQKKMEKSLKNQRNKLNGGE